MFIYKWDYVSVENVCKISAKKKLNSTVLVACEIFQFFRQKTWFLGNNKHLPYLGIGFA